MKRHFPTFLNIKRPYRIAFTLIAAFIVFAFIQLWRNEYLQSQEYVDFPIHSSNKKKDGEMRSKNYQLQTQEISPAVK